MSDNANPNAPPAEAPNNNNNNGGGGNNNNNNGGTGGGGGNQNNQNQRNHNSNNNNNNNNAGNNNNANNTPTLTTDKDFTGATAGLNSVLGLVFEKTLTNRTSYTQFKQDVVTHIEKEYDYGDIMQKVILEYADDDDEYVKLKPADLASTVNPDEWSSEKCEYETRMKAWINGEPKWNKTKHAAFNIIWGQLTPGLQSMIKAQNAYNDMSVACDCVWLLERIKLESTGIDSKGNPRVTFFFILLRLLNMRQSKTQSNEDYYRQFNEQVSIVELAGGGNIFFNPDVYAKHGSSLYDNVDLADGDTKVVPSPTGVEEEKERFKAILFLMRSCDDKYGDLKTRLANAAVLGEDNYPTTVADTYYLLNQTLIQIQCTSSQNRRNQPNPRTPAPNVLFLQGRVPSMLQGDLLDHHPACQFLQVLCKDWVLLDTASTCNCTNNEALISDITDCVEGEELNLLTNAGSKCFDKKGIFTLFPLDMFLNTNSLATVLSFFCLQSIDGVRITYDSDIDNVFHVMYQDQCYDFIAGGGGLYYFDYSSHKPKTTVSDYSTHHVSLLQSLDNNKKSYTARDITKAERAREVQEELGWPGVAALKTYIKHNLVHNSPVTIEDVSRAETIFGPAPPIIKGKMTRSTPSNTQLTPRLPLRDLIHEEYLKLTLAMDFFWLNGNVFLHTKTRNINYRTVSAVSSRSASVIISNLTMIRKMYHTRGFTITAYEGDPEFDIAELQQFALPAT